MGPTPLTGVDQNIPQLSNPAETTSLQSSMLSEPRYLLVGLPPPLPRTATREALERQSTELRAIAHAAMQQVQADYAQIQLMNMENEQLRKKAFTRQPKKKTQGSHARHMTGNEVLDELAYREFEASMKAVLKEAGPRFKAIRKAIADHEKQLLNEVRFEERRKKDEEKAAEKACKDAEKAEEKVRKEVEKAAEKVRKEAEQQAEKARKQSEKQAEKKRKAEEKAEEMAQKAVERAAQKLHLEEMRAEVKRQAAKAPQKKVAKGLAAKKVSKGTVAVENTPLGVSGGPGDEPSQEEADILLNTSSMGNSTPPSPPRPRPRPRPLPKAKCQAQPSTLATHTIPPTPVVELPGRGPVQGADQLDLEAVNQNLGIACQKLRRSTRK
ncbi:hypothetical protein JOM56_000247 [Amanita muscaria]